MKNTKRTVATKTSEVEIVVEETVGVRVGKDTYGIKTTEDGRGIAIFNGKGNLFLPFSAEGNAIVGVIVKKMAQGLAQANGRRRTNTQLVAQRGTRAKTPVKAKAKK